jgi:hypothetical protein
MQTYQGNNIIKGYRKYFGTSALCAALELQMLGCDIPEDQIQKIREDEYKRHQMEQERKRKKTMLQIPLTNEQDPWSNENYAFIAGYTSAGFPYGVTWEEAQLVTPVPDTNL